MIDNLNNTKIRTIDDYTIRKTIGEGNFGKVKLRGHVPTHEKVAIKIM